MTDIRKYIRLIESQESSLSTFVDSHKDSLPIRLKGFINTYYDGEFDKFLKAIERFENVKPDKANHILDKAETSIIKLSLLIKELNNSATINVVSYHEVANDGNSLVDDKSPNYVFRYVSKEELESIKEHGMMIPSKFYGRIHASYKPQPQYKVPNGALLAIEFDNDWKIKETLGDDELYVVTDKYVPVDKIKIVNQ